MNLKAYTLQQLVDLKQTIDRKKEPTKAAQIDLEISQRAEAQANTLLAREKNGPFDQATKAYLRGIAELVVGVVMGLLLLRLEPIIAFQQWRLLCYLVILTSVVGGGYHILQALRSR